jgi:MoxR-like ATPase
MVNITVESEFKHYLEKVAVSQRTGGPLSRTAVGSYLIFIKNEKLFDYNPDKWRNTPSIYDIADLNKINEIIDTLSSDKGFVERDKNDNQGFRSRAIKQYRDFLKYRQGQIPPRTIQNSSNIIMQTLQKIFFGAPGTGKSHKIDYNLFKDKDGNLISKGIKEIPEDRKFRTTFHPDYDYAQFVGAYKPKKDGNAITYSFVPQVFAKAYAATWKQYFDAGSVSTVENQVYLVIEEINRGNCAQIFGDIFQLLDRVSDGSDKGFSQYSIDADCDFADWLKNNDAGLKSVWNQYKDEVGEGKLRLPPNLNILATMNTSDQSLFPMDSAFKRRFDWEYVPISFDGKDAAEYQIDIDGSRYSWQNFLEAVNDKILDLTESEDKQLGEFFIKPDSGKIISKERFLGKVMFYLWNEVCKDEHKNGSFFRAKINDNKDFFTFQDLYKKKDLLKLFMDELLKKE